MTNTSRSPTRVHLHIRHIPRIDIRVPRPNLTHRTTHRVFLRPPAHLWVVVACAELVQARGGIEVATGELPGVRDGLALVQAVAIGVVVVAVLDAATAIDHFQYRAEIVHQVVVRACCRPFIDQLPLVGTSVIRRRRASRSIHAQAQRTVDLVDAVEPHTVGLVGSTVDVAIGRVRTGRIYVRDLVLSIGIISLIQNKCI